MSSVVAVLLFLVRGVLLWFVVPAAFVVSVLASSYLRRHGVKFGQLLGWLDLNATALITRTVLRPLVPQPLPWLSLDELPRVTHRVRFFRDPL